MATQSEIFQRLFEPLTYWGPGSESSTCRALESIPEFPGRPDILDVGCGPGRQTLQLAARTGGRVSAVDLHAGALHALRQKARGRDLSDRIAPVRGSMAQLCFADACFDLIWSEGAIYCMGFEAGVEAWKRYLRPGGCLAVTELTWLTDRAPEPARLFWQQQYPAMATTQQNLEAMDRAGYRRIDHFVLPESDWWDHFYAGLTVQIESVKREFSADEFGEGRAVVDESEQEMELVRRYPDAFSYVFYIAQKPIAQKPIARKPN